MTCGIIKIDVSKAILGCCLHWILCWAPSSSHARPGRRTRLRAPEQITMQGLRGSGFRCFQRCFNLCVSTRVDDSWVIFFALKLETKLFWGRVDTKWISKNCCSFLDSWTNVIQQYVSGQQSVAGTVFFDSDQICLATEKMLRSHFESKITVFLVGGLNPSEKYLSIGITIPNIWENRFDVPNHQACFKFSTKFMPRWYLSLAWNVSPESDCKTSTGRQMFGDSNGCFDNLGQ